MSIYIHIPFCKTICSYCDFPKIIYNKNLVNKYLKALKKEVTSKYKGELIKTIYIGGGTPSSLNINQLKYLFSIIKIFKLAKKYEFTFECNIDDLNINKIKLLYQNKVNRLSIGVQTFNKEFLKLLNRNHNYLKTKRTIDNCKRIGFNNINIDLIYAIPNEKTNDLKKDLALFLKLEVNHISTYSLMIEQHTVLYINKTKEIDEELDYKMYKEIIKTLKNNHFIHYETSNFAKKGYESKHNLIYWNNKHYYGFGAGASGYIDNIRYDNTKSVFSYINNKYIMSSNTLKKEEIIENEFILGFRKIKGINKKDFFNKYNINIKDINIIKTLLNENKLKENKNNIYINKKYLYLSNTILTRIIGEICLN